MTLKLKNNTIPLNKYIVTLVSYSRIMALEKAGVEWWRDLKC